MKKNNSKYTVTIAFSDPPDKIIVTCRIEKKLKKQRIMLIDDTFVCAYLKRMGYNPGICLTSSGLLREQQAGEYRFENLDFKPVVEKDVIPTPKEKVLLKIVEETSSASDIKKVKKTRIKKGIK